MKSLQVGWMGTASRPDEVCMSGGAKRFLSEATVSLQMYHEGFSSQT